MIFVILCCYAACDFVTLLNERRLFSQENDNTFVSVKFLKKGLVFSKFYCNYFSFLRFLDHYYKSILMCKLSTLRILTKLYKKYTIRKPQLAKSIILRALDEPNTLFVRQGICFLFTFFSEQAQSSK